MKTLQQIKKENEVILTITITGDYCNYNLIMDEDIHDDDIGEIMEYTLHRMVEEKFTEEEIYFNSGFFTPTSEGLEELEEFNEFCHIDLGFVLGGLIISTK